MDVKFALTHKALLLVMLFLAMELGLLGTLTTLLKQAEYEVWKESHSNAIVAEVNTLVKLFYDAGLALVAYGGTHSQSSAERYNECSNQIPRQLRTLKLLAETGPSKDKDISMERIDVLSDTALTSLRKAKRMVDERGESLALMGAHGMHADLERAMKQLMAELNKLADEERARHASWAGQESSARLRIKQCIVFGVAINILFAVAIVSLFMTRISRRISRLVDNTHRLAKRDRLLPVATGSDEIAHLDRVFHEMADALAEAERVKQEFLSIISHELRTPLSSIQGTLALLDAGAYGEMSEQGRLRVSNAEESATRLIKLINELLEIQKISAGKMKMQFASTQLGPVLDRSMELAKVLAEKKGVNLQPVKTDAEAYVDETRIEQVLINLLANAIKHCPTGSTVSTKILKDGDMVEFRVSDDGPGIDDSSKATIFERYEQGQTPNSDGTGLGLPICKSIVEEHKGTIGVESEVGKGSTFWFRIPK